jgi:hypothetical protein
MAIGVWNHWCLNEPLGSRLPLEFGLSLRPLAQIMKRK